MSSSYNNTTHDSVIPALQSMIARNRNELKAYSEELWTATYYYKYLLQHPNYDNYEEKSVVNHIRECKIQNSFTRTYPEDCETPPSSGVCRRTYSRV